MGTIYYSAALLASASALQIAPCGIEPSLVSSISWHSMLQKQMAWQPAHTSGGSTSLMHTRQRRTRAVVGRGISGCGRPLQTAFAASSTAAGGASTGNVRVANQPQHVAAVSSSALVLLPPTLT